MSQDILVEVFVPALSKSYDLVLSKELKVGEILDLLGPIISELNHGHFLSSDQTVLCNRETGQVQDVNATVTSLNYRNGEKLMLV